MPKIIPTRPAALYAPDLPGAREALLPVLTARRLFAVDDRSERLADMDLPVLQRPVLRLNMLHAMVGGPYFADVFVTDSLGTISSDETERVAVVGALLEMEREVVVGGQDLDRRWYQDRAARLDFGVLTGLVEALQQWDGVAIWEQHADATGARRAVLPSTVTMTNREARLRAKELIECEGLTPQQAADRLMAEGHVNEADRRTWYPKAVRAALDAGL
ncbi:MAG: hypothetical protein NVSMB55_00650 [Mycobacteriales bacterium]